MSKTKQKFFIKIDNKGEMKFYDKVGLAMFLQKIKGNDGSATIEKETKKRSNQQNNSLHRLFDLISKECEQEGVSVNMIIEILNKKGVEIIPTPAFIKELWRVVQIAVLKKHSTTKLTRTQEIEKVYEPFNKFIGENWGIHVPFPSEDNPMYS